MAYQGYLVQVGDYKMPPSIIRAETYVVTRYGQDLDSYQDANGFLHRTALEHFVAKVEFETIPLLTDRQFADFMSNIQRNYINTTEKKVSASVFIPELNDYMSQDMYVPDIPVTIYYADEKKLQYNQIRVALIGY